MRKIYKELYEILNLLGNAYIDLLPSKLYQLICDNKDDTYKVEFTSLEDITEKNCRKQTISIIALLHLNYWCESDIEKDNLKLILNENTIKNEEIKKEKYNPDNLFKKENNDLEYKERRIEEEIKKEVSMVKYDESFFMKIWNKILRIFKR